MNEYFTSLRAIARSSTELLTGQYHSLDSLEIKESATALHGSIQPCLNNLLQAQAQLGRNLIGCIKTLEQSEAVWHSKQQIVAVSDSVVLEKVGEISGCWNRLQNFAAEEKVKIVEQAGQNWLNQIEELKREFFLDSKKQHRAGIGWADKDRFRRELPDKVKSISKSLDSKIEELLDQLRQQALLQEAKIGGLHSVHIFIDMLDPELKAGTIQEKETLLAELGHGLDQKLNNLSGRYTLSLFQGVNDKIAEWQRRFGDILWEEVTTFGDKGLANIKKRVEFVINDRLDMLHKVVKWALTFYNHFLDRQKRYQQETLEQRLAEKAWLDQQRHLLQQLSVNVEMSLSGVEPR